MWSDLNYGLGNLGGLNIWVEAATSSSGSYYVLMNYFKLTPTQMDLIIDMIKNVLNFGKLTIENHWCAKYPQYPCNDTLLAAVQWVK